MLFKRVKNIARDLDVVEFTMPSSADRTCAVDRASCRRSRCSTKSTGGGRIIEGAAAHGGSYRRALREASPRFKPVVDKFFDDVLVMADDAALRRRRLRLLRRLRDR